MIVLDQVDVPDTGVVTRGLLAAIGEVAASSPSLPMLADSRRGPAGWPPLSFKTNAAELAVMLGRETVSLDVACRRDPRHRHG